MTVKVNIYFARGKKIHIQYATVQQFGVSEIFCLLVLKRLIVLFSKDVFSWSKMTNDHSFKLTSVGKIYF